MTLQPILIVDDDFTVRDIVQQMLTLEGHIVVEAATGRAGLRAWEQHDPQLVILDIVMSGISGLPDADHFLHANTKTVQWLPDAHFKLDVSEFEETLQQAESVTAAQHAVDLYQGELLPGCYDDWLLAELMRSPFLLPVV